MLLIVLGGVLTWLSQPLPMPKVSKTVQLTYDGVSKTMILTDGSRLFATERAGPTESLVQASVTGGDISVIPTPFTSTTLWDISPDHSRLLVADRVGAESEMQAWVLPLPTGNPRHLSNVVARTAVWSADGRQLAFAKGSEIYLANADGTNVRTLIAVSGWADWIRFSPDGTRLRFTLTSKTNSASIWEVRTDGSQLHALLPEMPTRISTSECCGVWSADGH